MICSFECTFCKPCAEGRLHGRCPNCSGNLSLRPTCKGDALRMGPASMARKLRDTPCPGLKA